MKRFLTLLLWMAPLLVPRFVTAQYPGLPINAHDPALPAWVKMMYSPAANVREVRAAYETWAAAHPLEKDSYTRYYKRWCKAVAPYTDGEGNIHMDAAAGAADLSLRTQIRASQKTTGSNWSFAGPEVHYHGVAAAGDPLKQATEQANTYCIDQSLSHPDILYCGTENGGVYKSTNKGVNWQYVTRTLPLSDVRALRIHPTNPDIVLATGNNKIYKTTDGGITWNPTGDAAFQAMNLYVWDIAWHPTHPDTIFAGADQGLFRTTDGGATWNEMLPNRSMSVVMRPGTPDILYALHYNTTTQIPDFYKSTDGGVTWTVKPSGWFQVPSIDAGKITSEGGRIAVTQANPDKVYVLLVGESQSTAFLQLRGTIGVYRSADAGETWSFPHGAQGMPYNVNTHPNLMDFDGYSSNYSQIYYNTALAASQVVEDHLLIGGLNLWRSQDGGGSYLPVGGYIGSAQGLHVDFQDLEIYKTGPTTEELWIASDGGVNYTTDLVATNESRTRGIWGSAFWGFDQGWNEDMMIGGRYHNGNGGYHEGYEPKAFISLGGGEAPTGYANYSHENRVYASDIGGRILPDSLDGVLTGTPANLFPNESYWENSSSRILFDWHYWNIGYLGKDNQIYKTEDGGATWQSLYTFGASGNRVYWIEQSRVNPDILYAQVVMSNISRLWKSTDRGTTWTLMTLPQNLREMVFSLSPDNADELWCGFTYAPNGNKVYFSSNGGTTWVNRSGSTLNGLRIKSIACQGGTDRGVYIAVREAAVYYRNESLGDWVMHGNNLPVITDPLRLVPFYKDQKLRLATWNMGIWEIALYEPAALRAGFSVEYPEYRYFCVTDTVQFNDHSICTAAATYAWSFPGGVPATSTDKYPRVTYGSPGTYDVTLIVTDGAVSDTVTQQAFVTALVSPVVNLPLNEGFETGVFAADWQNVSQAGSWQINGSYGGFGLSTHAMMYDNFNFDAGGAQDAIQSAKYDFSAAQGAKLWFDVAYAEYGFPYSDSLSVRVTTDCGATWTQLYYKGGNDLQTAPDNSNDYFPAAGEWRTDTVDLSAFDGAPELIVAFVNHGRFGNRIWMDNINLSYTGLVNRHDPLAQNGFHVWPVPASTELNLRWQGASWQPETLRITDMQGRTVLLQAAPDAPVWDLRLPLQLPAGVYAVTLLGAGGEFVTAKAVVR